MYCKLEIPLFAPAQSHIRRQIYKTLRNRLGERIDQFFRHETLKIITNRLSREDCDFSTAIVIVPTYFWTCTKMMQSICPLIGSKSFFNCKPKQFVEQLNWIFHLQEILL